MPENPDGIYILFFPPSEGIYLKPKKTFDQRKILSVGGLRGKRAKELRDDCHLALLPPCPLTTSYQLPSTAYVE
jgi:hypothetical protein